MMSGNGKRKKWSEAEERSLIEKYGEMVSDGSLAKMKTREKKYKPIALHVNSVHNARDPVTYPWQWCWKDVSTKVQNMRHQYLLVKQKVKKPSALTEDNNNDNDNMAGFDWPEGVAHWSNFLRYKEVFGDFTPCPNASIGFVPQNGELGLDITEFDGDSNGFAGLGFGDDADGFVYEEVAANGEATDQNKNKKDSKSKNILKGLLLGLNNINKNKYKKNKNKMMMMMMKKIKNKKSGNSNGNSNRGWGILRYRMKKMKEERESEEREKRRRDNEEEEREWEERMGRRRAEWRERIEEMMGRHRDEMAQIQARIINDQQSMTNQLLGVVAHWASAAAHNPVVAMSDHTSAATNHYFSQMMQNMHHVNSLDDPRVVDGDNHDDQFIVDG